MAYEIVKCEVQYWATVFYTDAEGFTIDKQEDIGCFESKEDAENAFRSIGMVKLPDDVWKGTSCFGHINRHLKEIEE